MRKTLIAALFAATLPALALAAPGHDGGKHDAAATTCTPSRGST